VEEGLHAEDLKEEEQGKSVEIDLVDATVNDQVAQDAQENQSVYTAGREGEGEQGKAAKGRVRENAGGEACRRLWPMVWLKP
jgi:hypothetical protein